MILDQVCSDFEGLFASVEVSALSTAAAVAICSGAIGTPGTPPPVLCATEALALALWSRTATDYAAEIAAAAKKLIWVQEPSLLRFEMTIREASGAHRIATRRYAVYALCAFEDAPQDVVAAPCLKTTAEPEPQPVAITTKRRTKAPKPEPTSEPSPNNS